MGLRPLGDRVLVKRVEGEEKTAGGLYIPDSAKEKPQKGEVLAVGEGKVMEDGQVRPMTVKAGDKVLFSKYAGNEISLDGEDVMIMREDEILAVFN